MVLNETLHFPTCSQSIFCTVWFRIQKINDGGHKLLLLIVIYLKLFWGFCFVEVADKMLRLKISI